MNMTLATEPCEPGCNEVNEFLFSFIINSIDLKNEDKYSPEKTLSFTWDGNVKKLYAKSLVSDFIGKTELIVFASPMDMFKKLRNSPIMLNLMASCDDLGTIKLPISHCFAEAVLCGDFNSQRIKNEFKFTKDGKETASVDMDFLIEKIPRESEAVVLKAFEISNKNYQKKLKQKMKKKIGTSADNDEEEVDDEEVSPCPEFACTDELPAHCKKALDLGEHVYKIINGHLLNIRDKRGICGEACDVAKKYCKEYRNLDTSTTLHNSIDLDNIFTSRSLNKVKCQQQSSEDILSSNFFLKNDDMAKHHENQMKKIKEGFEYGCGDVHLSQCVTKKRNKKKLKKNISKRHNETLNCPTPPVVPYDPQKIFLKKMKTKFKEKYSYEFGNTYLFHQRLQCNILPDNHSFETVPKRMGWRHDKLNLSHNKKWFPGQINKTVRLLMKYHLHPYPYDTLTLSNAVNKRHSLDISCNDSNEQKNRETLHISKKNGEISLTMQPLKERKQLETDCNPYLNCFPLKFILKKHPEEMKKHQARVIMKARGCMRKCDCEKIKLCRCLSSIEKKVLKIEMKRLSAELKMKNEMQFEDVYETSDSEIDFEFTPPSVANAKIKCKADVAHTGTQYEMKHFSLSKMKKKCTNVEDKATADDGKNPKNVRQKINK